MTHCADDSAGTHVIFGGWDAALAATADDKVKENPKHHKEKTQQQCNEEGQRSEAVLVQNLKTNSKFKWK